MGLIEDAGGGPVALDSAPLIYYVEEHAAFTKVVESDSPSLTLVPLDLGQLRSAARLRATHVSLKVPDALQLSAALSTRCSAFVSNDRRLPRIPGLRVLKLSDYA